MPILDDVSEALQPLGAPPLSASDAGDVVAFPLPPTSGPLPPTSAPLPPTSDPAPVAPPVAPPLTPPPAAAAPAQAPAADELSALRAKVEEQAHVIELAKTRVETLGAEKFQALEQVQLLQEQLEAAQVREVELRRQIAELQAVPALTPDELTLAELAKRVAALEARLG